MSAFLLSPFPFFPLAFVPETERDPFIRRPNEPNQSNISPTDAAAAYKKYFEPVNADRKGAPAVTSGSDGMDWLESFLEACSDCQVSRPHVVSRFLPMLNRQSLMPCSTPKIDFLAIHVYCVTGEEATGFMNAFRTKWPSYKIWITEIGCQDYSGKNVYCTQDMANSMLDAVMELVWSDNMYERLAWYGE